MIPSLPPDWTETVTVSRTAPGHYPAGTWTPGPPVMVPDLVACVIPMSPEEIEELDLGEQVKEAITVYTQTQLFTSSQVTQTQADRLTWKGDQYEVAIVAYRNQLPSLAHYKAVAKRVEET